MQRQTIAIIVDVPSPFCSSFFIFCYCVLLMFDILFNILSLLLIFSMFLFFVHASSFTPIFIIKHLYRDLKNNICGTFAFIVTSLQFYDSSSTYVFIDVLC